jgi:hypothetical protein
MTAEFQLTVKMLMDSICLAIHEEDASAQNPSPVQSRFAKTLGRGYTGKGARQHCSLRW